MRSEKNKQIANGKWQTVGQNCYFATIFVIIFVLFLISVPTNAETIDSRFYPTTTTISAPQSIDNLAGHFNNKIKIVFSDVDGTLIPFNKTDSKAVVPESVNQSAQKLKQVQIPFVLVTGRSFLEANYIIKEIGNENSYIIAQHGAEIIAPDGKIIYKDHISNKDSKKIIKAVENFNKANNLNLKSMFYVDGKSYSKEYFRRPYGLGEIIKINSYNELEPDFTSGRIVLFDTNTENLKLAQAYLKKKFPSYHINVSAACYCDITTLTSTKGNAIKKLTEILNINLKNAAVFGDAENDISMLKLVKDQGGLAIAVGNAMSSTKNNANFVTAPVTQDGFAKAVGLILINNNKLNSKEKAGRQEGKKAS